MAKKPLEISPDSTLPLRIHFIFITRYESHVAGFVLVFVCGGSLNSNPEYLISSVSYKDVFLSLKVHIG